MSKYFVCAFAILFLYVSQPSFAATTKIENDAAKATLNLGPSELVKVSVKTVTPIAAYPYSKSYFWGGDKTTPPKKIIETISISKSTNTIDVPLSAYSDLGNPAEISLKKLSAHGFQIKICGGDAGGSYCAMLDFKNEGIIRRKVVHNEFPNQIWEETTYTFIQPDN